jgi:hypothetical protein
MWPSQRGGLPRSPRPGPLTGQTVLPSWRASREKALIGNRLRPRRYAGRAKGRARERRETKVQTG